MPIQFPDFNRISFGEANPALIGAEAGQDIYGKMLSNQIENVKAQYAQPMAGQALQKAQLENIWLPKMNQSTINLQTAQGGLAGAQAGLANQQAQYVAPQAQAEIALQQAQAAHANIQAKTNAFWLSMYQGKARQQNQQDYQNDQGTGTSQTPIAGVGASTHDGSDPNNQAGETVYGIPTPQPTMDDIVNKKMGMDTFTPKQTNAFAQQQDQYKKYQDDLAQTTKDASIVTNAKQILALYNHHMDMAFYKGSRLGATPVQGWRASLIPRDLSHEQAVDNLVAKQLPGAISNFQDVMHTNHFTNTDVNSASLTKPSRNWDDDARQYYTEYTNAVTDRLNEKAKFLSVLNNPKTGPLNSVANQAWVALQNEFPIVNADGKTLNQDAANHWWLFTTPKALASIKATGAYHPSKAELNTVPMRYPDGNIYPVKKDSIAKALKKKATLL